MHFKNYYEVLGVSKIADLEEIRKEFRRLAMRHNPDHNPQNIAQAEAKFKDINKQIF